MGDAYPAPLKNILKASPVLIIFTGLGLLFCTAINDIIYHPHDRVERFYFRSNKFEKLVRKRDEKLRYYYKPYSLWNPSDSHQIDRLNQF
jgi:hypothetical protein